ncbi:hypothetical protein [Rhizobium sullae]|nr:hypothetical protein [Rhizobium sullae]
MPSFHHAGPTAVPASMASLDCRSGHAFMIVTVDLEPFTASAKPSTS